MIAKVDSPRTVVCVIRVVALWLFFGSLPALAIVPAAWREGLGQTAIAACGGGLAITLWLAAWPVARWVLRRAGQAQDPVRLPYHVAIAVVGLTQLVLAIPSLIQSVTDGINWHHDQAVRWSTALLTQSTIGESVAVMLAVVCVLIPGAVARVGGGLGARRHAEGSARENA